MYDFYFFRQSYTGIRLLPVTHRYSRVQACVIYQFNHKISSDKFQWLEQVTSTLYLSKYKVHFIQRFSVFMFQFHSSLCIVQILIDRNLSVRNFSKAIIKEKLLIVPLI